MFQIQQPTAFSELVEGRQDEEVKVGEERGWLSTFHLCLLINTKVQGSEG